MCSFPTVMGTALEIRGNYLGQRAAYKQAQAQIDAQAKAAITQMNYAFQNYEQERTDAFDSAVSEIMQTRTNAQQLNSSVKAAVAENATGRTAGLLLRTTEGDTARAISSIKDNYDRKSNEVDLNKEATYKSTRDFIGNLNASAPKMPSRFANLMTSAVSVVGNTTTALNQKAEVLSKGHKYNWWTGGAKLGQDVGKKWVGNVPLSVHRKTGKGMGKYM